MTRQNQCLVFETQQKRKERTDCGFRSERFVCAPDWADKWITHEPRNASNLQVLGRQSVGLQLYLLPLPCFRALQQISEGKREKSDSVQEAVRVK